jgi:manganese oxidase
VNLSPRGAAAFWAAVAAVLAVFLSLTMALAFTQPPVGQPAAPADTSFEVSLTEFAVEPAELTAPTGSPLRFSVINDGALGHDLTIEGVGATPFLNPGDSADLEVMSLAAGTYRLWCTIAGHADAGMEGTLTVLADGDPAAALPAGDHLDHPAMRAEEMAAKHEQGVADFPAETEGRGNQPLEPVIDADGMKVFELTATHVEWETEPGKVLSGMAYNGQIPGPQLNVDLGDDVRVVLHNELEVPTAIHFHGLLLPNAMDGVPGLTQRSVLPGQSFTYEFPVRNSGSHMYHSHFDAAVQVPSGLLGAFVVHGPDEPEVDHDIVMILNDGPLGYTLNGKGFPATEPLALKQGETARIRYYNEGLQIHPMHTHGMAQKVIARDSYPLEVPYLEDNVLVSPGDRVDVIIEPDEPGIWAWHCHILTHAEAPDGMFGMVTAIIVE